MLKSLTISMALLVSAHADTDCNVKLREGSLSRLEMPQSVERQIINPDKTIEKKQLPAKAGFKYAVLTLTLAAGKSVSLYDYALQTEGGDATFNTLGMSVDGAVFQRTTWEVRANGNPQISWVGLVEEGADKVHFKGRKDIDADSVIKLIFEVPAGSTRFQLVSRLLNKNLAKEYGVSKILDFENMSEPAAAPAEEEQKESVAPKE